MNLVQWRNLHKINQADFAEKANVAVTTVIKYERGEDIRDSSKKKIENFITKIDGGLFVQQKKDYSPKSISIDDLWQYIPKEYNYLAKEQSGEIYLHKNEPKLNNGGFESDSCTKLPLNVYFDELDWKKCISKRPFNYWDYIGKIGIFTDKSNPDFMIIGKLESIDLDCDSPFKKEGSFKYTGFRPLSEKEKEELA